MAKGVGQGRVADADRANVMTEVADVAETASMADKVVAEARSTPDEVVDKAPSTVDNVVSKAASMADKQQQQGQRDSVTVAMYKVN